MRIEDDNDGKKTLGPKNGPITATYHDFDETFERWQSLLSIRIDLRTHSYIFQSRELCTKCPFVVFVIFIVCDVSCVSNSVPIFAGPRPFNTENI